ncbi:hypothetical protein EG329_000166 [Mollisiaceae sp. DMI_Dod_QoI]|nr:hypothetical protein EG329_000166 [Helotiales sp. DMI_Dod_QoI]
MPTEMLSLIVKLKPDIEKIQAILNVPSQPNGRILRKRTAPDEKNPARHLTKKFKMDEDASWDVNQDEIIKKPGKLQNTAYYVNTTAQKPEPHGTPIVWADKRQQLCETLPFYNAYQSGAYTKDGILYGFLVDAEVGSLDKFDDQIIITTIGGDRAKDAQGNKIQKPSSDFKASGIAARRTMEECRPVLVIAGQGNVLSPSKLPHYYNVLGWFQITNIWRETDKKTWKIRFEKIDLTERSWWAAKGTYPPGSAPLTPNYESPKTTIQVCGHCQNPSKLIYEQGWTCLDVQCGQFFKFEDNAVDNSKLSYTGAFLGERTQYTGHNPGPLAPQLPTQQDLDTIGTTPFDLKFKKGIVCPNCGCCSRRVQWHQWACENSGCDFVHCMNTRAISIDEAIAEGMLNPRALKEYHHPSVLLEEVHTREYKIYQYALPGPDGTTAGLVRLFKATGLVNRQRDGPDDMFHQIQEGNFKLSRNAVRNKGLPSEIATSHFASNWGALYKYGVTPTTSGFNEAPLAIIRALKRLTYAGKYTVEGSKEDFDEFNELLLIGYNEKSHMDYHDDGEKTLGPTVATLSLGAHATMHFRPKKNSPIGEPKKSKNSKANKPDSLKIVLNHGDLLIMHGTAIHAHYEHAVNPHGKLRFALTARFIKPELMQNEADREFARLGGILPFGHEQFDYDGDINSQPVPWSTSAFDSLCAMFNTMALQGRITEDQAERLTQSSDAILN